MSDFNAGSLVFQIKTVGRELLTRDLASAQSELGRTGTAAQTAGEKVTKSGDATEQAGKKAKDAAPKIREQGDATRRAGDENDNAAPKVKKATASIEEQRAAATKLGTALLAAGVAVGAMVGLAVAKYADFDQAMSNVSAATMATTSEQKKLAEAAMDAGADTAYSAREAADAEEELAKAGLSVSEIVGGSLNGALSLAAAGQLQVARSAEIMATTLKQFNLTGDKSAHVSDLLAAGAGKAQGSVDDLALALQYVGPVAAGLGLTLEETTGTLALFASKGQLGERAGTGLRGVLMSLTAPSQLAAKTMNQYGIEIFDADGKMKSMAQISEILRTKLGGLTDAERQAALGRIFGNEQITAANVLMEGGAKAVREWTDEVNDSGYAALQAAERQNNLAGDIEKLGGAFDTALIKTGSGANEVLRTMVQGLTGLVDLFADAPDGVQQFGLLIGIAAGAVALLAGGAVVARAKFAELKAQMDLTNTSMRSTALIGGAVGLALTGILTVVTLVASAQAEAAAKAKAYADTLESGTFRITQATKDMARENLAAKRSFMGFGEMDSALEVADQLGLNLGLVADAAARVPGKLEELQTELGKFEYGSEGARKKAEELGIGSADLAVKIHDVKQAVAGESESIEKAIESQQLKDKANAESAASSQASVDASKSAADAYLEEASRVEDLNRQLRDLIDSIQESNVANQTAIGANLTYTDTLREVDEYIAKAREGVEGYSISLDTNTQVGSDNMKMLLDLAGKSQIAAEKQFELDSNTQSYIGTLQAGREALIQRAMDLGYTSEQATALADAIYSIPTEREVTVLADTSSAQSNIDRFIYLNNGRSLMLYAGLNIEDPAGRYANGAVVDYYAQGGTREHHVAQIARAGSWRVWAEPETGGEAYIPLAESKRARSTAILENVAGRFGYELVPRGARSFADGGSVGEPTIAPSIPPVPRGGSQVVLVNPVVRDLMSDAWRAAQILDAGEVE